MCNFKIIAAVADWLPIPLLPVIGPQGRSLAAAKRKSKWFCPTAKPHPHHILKKDFKIFLRLTAMAGRMNRRSLM
jgi:hypothetical protein